MLLAIGYWRSVDDYTLPDPSRFVDASWDQEERKRTIEYLEKGEEIAVEVIGNVYDWCRFRSKEQALYSTPRTDGYYVWPQSLIHYLKDHDIRLPEQFVKHVRKESVFHEMMTTDIDFSWWKKQQGFTISGKKSYLSPVDYGLLSINNDTKKDLKVLVSNFFKENTRVRRKYAALDAIQKGLPVAIVGSFSNLNTLLEDLVLINVKHRFEPYDFVDFESMRSYTKIGESGTDPQE